MPKLLGEFLQEQQEPFVLHVYLIERGCYARRPRKRRQQSIPNCAAIVRGVFSRLVLHNNQKIKNTGINGRGEGLKVNDPRKEEEDDDDDDDEDADADEEDDNDDADEDEDEFSSASATTLYNSCSESDVGDAECNTKQSSFSHQLGPVSTLEETEYQGSPLHRKQYSFKKRQGESSKASYKRSDLKQPKQAHDQHSINRRALQQTKQLLVDCVREVIENERKRDDGTGQQLKKILGAEELWKLVSENVWVWSQDSIDETNIVHMLHCDFMASLEEWSSAYDQHRNETAMEIGDAILDDIVNEIVTCH